MDLNQIRSQAAQAIRELLEAAKPQPGDIVVIGCSSSEAAGHRIGTDSSLEVAEAVFEGLFPAIKKNGLYLAAQCCEHLNRALIVERETAVKYGLEQVNVMPQPKAGGSFATTAWRHFSSPVAVEEVKAACGIDIGGTLIGMHLKRLQFRSAVNSKIGEASILCARTRPKFIGGIRAAYDDSLL